MNTNLGLFERASASYSCIFVFIRGKSSCTTKSGSISVIDCSLGCAVLFVVAVAAFLAALALISALVYLLSVNQFSYYRDDWYYAYDGYIAGPSIFKVASITLIVFRIRRSSGARKP